MSNSSQSYRELIRTATTEAAEAMRKQRWPNATVVTIRTRRFPFQSNTRVLWAVQICGKSFDLKHDILPEDCKVADYPVWLASDGNLYEFTLVGDRPSDETVAPLMKAGMHDWSVRELDGAYVLVLQALLKIPSK